MTATEATSGLEVTYDFVVTVNECPEVASMSIGESINDISVAFSGTNKAVELNSGSAITVTAYDTKNVVILNSCLQLTFTVIDNTGAVEKAYGGSPLSLDSSSTPTTISIADLEGKVESGSYSFAIEVKDASSSTASGLANFNVQVQSDTYTVDTESLINFSNLLSGDT